MTFGTSGAHFHHGANGLTTREYETRLDRLIDMFTQKLCIYLDSLPAINPPPWALDLSADVTRDVSLETCLGEVSTLKANTSRIPGAKTVHDKCTQLEILLTACQGTLNKKAYHFDLLSSDTSEISDDKQPRYQMLEGHTDVEHRLVLNLNLIPSRQIGKHYADCVNEIARIQGSMLPFKDSRTATALNNIASKAKAEQEAIVLKAASQAAKASENQGIELMPVKTIL